MIIQERHPTQALQFNGKNQKDCEAFAGASIVKYKDSEEYKNNPSLWPEEEDSFYLETKNSNHFVESSVVIFLEVGDYLVVREIPKMEAENGKVYSTCLLTASKDYFENKFVNVNGLLYRPIHKMEALEFTGDNIKEVESFCKGSVTKFKYSKFFRHINSHEDEDKYDNLFLELDDDGHFGACGFFLNKGDYLIVYDMPETEGIKGQKYTTGFTSYDKKWFNFLYQTVN